MQFHLILRTYLELRLWGTLVTSCDMNLGQLIMAKMDFLHLRGRHHGKSGCASGNKVSYIAAIQADGQDRLRYVMFS
jgi:hypothetical protein